MAIRIHELVLGDFDRGAINNLIPSNFTSQTAISAGATSAAFAATTNVVIIEADESVHVAFGATPTATTDNPLIPAGEYRAFEVNGGDKVDTAAA